LQNRPDIQGDLIADEEIKDNIVLFLFAGHDTSSITLAAILKYLSLNPHCLHEVVKEQEEIAKVKAGAPLNWEDTQKMKYTWWVMQETLRLQSPVVGAFRKSLKEFEYGGFRIPKGCQVIFVWASEIGARP
jgi:cytochrome P450